MTTVGDKWPVVHERLDKLRPKERGIEPRPVPLRAPVSPRELGAPYGTSFLT